MKKVASLALVFALSISHSSAASYGFLSFIASSTPKVEMQIVPLPYKQQNQSQQTSDTFQQTNSTQQENLEKLKAQDNSIQNLPQTYYRYYSQPKQTIVQKVIYKTDTQKLNSLEQEVQDIKSQLKDLADRISQATQSQSKSKQVIYKMIAQTQVIDKLDEVKITNSSVDSTPIGQSEPDKGKFTQLEAENFSVTGSSTIAGDLSVGGNQTIAGTLSVSGTTTLATTTITNLSATSATFSNATTTGNQSILGNLSVGGDTSLENTTAHTLTVTNSFSAPLPHGYVWRGNASGMSEATNALYIADSGNIGIGTVSPTSKLHIAGGLKIGNANPYNPDSNYYDSESYIAFRDGEGSIFSEDFIGYKDNTFYFKDSPGGGDAQDPNVVIGGRLGVGNETPTSMVHIGSEDTTDNAVLRISGNGSGSPEGGDIRLSVAADYDSAYDFWFIDAFEDDFRIGQEGNTKVLINQDGNVGIGTTNPVYGKLVVQQSTSPNSSSGITVRSDDGNTLRFWWDEANTIARIDAGASGNSNIALLGTGTGNIGIGTTAPAEKLHVAGKIKVGNALTLSHTNSVSTEPDIDFHSQALLAAQSNFIVNIDSDNTETGAGFIIKADGLTSSARDLFVVKDTGRVGIGVSNPLYELDVSGSGRIAGSLDVSNGVYLPHGQPVAWGSNSIYGYSSGTDAILFNTAGTERVRIDASGNVGIGVSSPQARLDIVGDPRMLISNTDANNAVKQGLWGTRHYLNSEEPFYALQAYTNSTENKVYIGGGTGYGNAATDIYFNTAANNTTTVGTTRMVINSVGNVGIGTTNPTFPATDQGGLHVGSNIPGGQAAIRLDNANGEYALLSRWTNRFKISSTNDLELTDGTGGVVYMTGGRVGINTYAPLDVMHVAGDIRVGTGTTGCVKDADGTVIAGTCSSDERLKTDIEEINNIIDKFDKIRVVNYKWNELAHEQYAYGTEANQIGVIAQDIQKAFPELVVEDSKGYKQVNYTGLSIYSLGAIKELWLKLKSLLTWKDDTQDKIKKLEKEIEYLKSKLNVSDSSEDNSSNDAVSDNDDSSNDSQESNVDSSDSDSAQTQSDTDNSQDSGSSADLDADSDTENTDTDVEDVQTDESQTNSSTTQETNTSSEDITDSSNINDDTNNNTNDSTNNTYTTTNDTQTQQDIADEDDSQNQDSINNTDQTSEDTQQDISDTSESQLDSSVSQEDIDTQSDNQTNNNDLDSAVTQESSSQDDITQAN